MARFTHTQKCNKPQYDIILMCWSKKQNSNINITSIQFKYTINPPATRRERQLGSVIGLAMSLDPITGEVGALYYTTGIHKHTTSYYHTSPW